MNIVFCADRGVLAGLHVAMYSLLKRMSPAMSQTLFFVFSDQLNESDLMLLHETLAPLKKPFALALRRVDAASFTGFPSLNGSWTTYYRLFAAQTIEAARFLYVDADTLCDVDVSELQALGMDGAPAAWVPEAPLAHAVDRRTAEELGNAETEFYFNAGVMLVNVNEWRCQKITDKTIQYIVERRPVFHDQSALNFVLHRKALTLDPKFNCMSNMRKNWPVVKQPYGKIGGLVHFLDYPKPWDFLGEFVHPQYQLWRTVLDQTAMKDFRSWQATPSRKFPKSRKARAGYKKALKDRLLFAGYRCGWLRNVKGVPVNSARDYGTLRIG